MAEAEYGAGWVWNPGRWGTVDGWVDLHTLLAAIGKIRQQRALRRLELAAAFRLALGGEGAAALASATEREARGDGDGNG